MIPELQSLKSLHDKAHLEYEVWRDRAYNQVKKWRVASEPMQWLGYVVKEKNGLSQGRWLSPGCNSGFAHGLDDQDRIVVIKETKKFGHHVRTDETFFHYETNKETRLAFIPHWETTGWVVRAASAEVFSTAHGLPVSNIVVSDYAARVSSFESESERVARELVQEFRISDLEQPVKQHEYRFSYDDFGNVERIWLESRVLRSGETQAGLVYERSDQQHVKILLDQFASRLPEAISDAIARVQVAHQCYALLLQIIVPDGLFPPVLVASSQEYLESLSQLPATRRKAVAWDPGCHGFVGTPLEFHDRKFLQVCDRLTAAVASLPERVWRKQALQTIKAACCGANELGAANGLPHTQQPVIAAVDMHGEIVPYKLVADCVPTETEKRLKEQRLL